MTLTGRSGAGVSRKSPCLLTGTMGQKLRFQSMGFHLEQSLGKLPALQSVLVRVKNASDRPTSFETSEIFEYGARNLSLSLILFV